MANFCLAPEFADNFKRALADGTIDPAKLIGMSSAARRAFFEPIVGKENALDVNVLFESKLLLKDQQRGLVTWAKKVAGVSEPVRRDVLAKIQRMDKVLQPDTEESFLSDLAQQKLGVAVTAEEARQIYEAGQRAQQLDQAWTAAGRDQKDMARRIPAGRAQEDLTRLINSMKPKPDIVSWNSANEIWSLPTQLLTSVFHVSGLFVQAANMISRVRAWQGAGQMLRYFASEDAFRDNNAWIITHSDYPLLKQAKIALNDMNDKISTQEEYIRGHLVAGVSHYISSATGIPDLVRGSQRAFYGFLNYVRAKTFYDSIALARGRGEDLGPESRYVRDIGNIVNIFSGRGNLGPNDVFGAAAPALNYVLWAPRKLAAEVEVFNPWMYINPWSSRTARLEALKNITGTMAVTFSILGLAKTMGGQVSFDPDDPKFMQLQIMGTSFDFSGGRNSLLRMYARVAENIGTRMYDYVEDTPYHQPYGTPSAATTMLNFLRYKLVPAAAFVVDALTGTDPTNRPFDMAEEAYQKFTPIFMAEIIDLFYNDPKNFAAWALSPIGAFGVQIRTPFSEPHLEGMNMWGEPAGPFDRPSQDPVDEELRQLGYRPSFPEPMIGGVQLSGEQFRTYIRTAGQNARENIETDMSQPDWADFPKEKKLAMIRADVAAARSDAVDQIKEDDLAMHPNGDSLIDKIDALHDQKYGETP